MISRLLPIEEWPRLPEHFQTLLPHVQPSDVQILVVEDGDRIVATWAVMRIVHVEGIWIDAEYRGRVGVARRLYLATMAAARQWTTGWAMTGADSDEVRALLARAGAQQIPMDTYVLPLKGTH